MKQALLGQILLDFQIISEDQLSRCLAVQDTEAVHRPLGEILLEQKVVDEETLSSILGVQHRRIGIDRAQGKLSQDELAQRLAGASIRTYLQTLVELGGSELMLSSETCPTVRLHGNLVDLPAEAMSLAQTHGMIFPLLTQPQITTYYDAKSLRLTLDLPDLGRFRLNVYRHLTGMAANFRLLSSTPRELKELGLPAATSRFSEYSHGLILVTGPAGSGKTTTLAAIVNDINRSQARHIVTIDDVIEVKHQNQRSLVSQIEIGRHATSFKAALRDALRQDPDVIVIGDLRDPEMAATALTAAETGHLVLGTLPTQNAIGTIYRYLDQFPAGKRTQVRTVLAGCLRAVLCQQLVPNRDGTGRSLASELLFVNHAVANLIREDRAHQIGMVMQTQRQEGMQTLEESLNKFVKSGRISVEEAISRAVLKDEIYVERYAS